MLKIISGGQTGVDNAGLVAARKCGLSTGGHMPKGFKQEKGNAPHYRELYGMDESSSSDYTVRTDLNIKNSHATIIFYDGAVGKGTKRTMDKCSLMNRPYVAYNMLEHMNDLNSFIDRITNDLLNFRDKFGDDVIINVAGTRGSKLGMKNENILTIVLSEAFNNYKKAGSTKDV